MEHHVDPERAQFDAFKALPRDQPIEMLNLVRFREHADYPADHPLRDANLTGAQAYGCYGQESAPVFRRVGGSILWTASLRMVLIGPADEQWDAIFVARYPRAAAFLEMVIDPVYQQAVKHRQAAVATSRLIRTAPAAQGAPVDRFA